MIRKVLIGMDGTENSRESLRFVQELLPNCEVTLVRVIEYLDTLPAYQEVLWSQRRQQVEEYLKSVVESLDVPVETLVKEGSPAHEILEVAESIDADLIAMTTHGGSAARRRFLGGTTEKLLHCSDVPLLVLPRPLERETVHKPLQRILVPLDGSEIAEAILPLASWLAASHQARILLVKVLEDSEEAARRLPEIKDRLEKAGCRIQPPDCFDKVLVRMGEPARTLARTAEIEEAGLITMSAHGYGAMKRMLLGSVASKLVRETNVPVLMARHEALYSRS